MRVYKFENATIYVHGTVNKERLRKATVKFIKNSYRHKQEVKACQQ